MSVFALPAKIQKINRLRQIASILVKHQVISTSRKAWTYNPVALVRRLAGHTQSLDDKEAQGRLIRSIIEDLGTTFIKFGQWMSVRPDIVPSEILVELEHLQDNLAPLPFKTIRRAVEAELGRPLDEVFSQFDQQGISTASIAQVHRAVLHTGEEVAVKVQHPYLRRRINTDINILNSLALWAVKNWPHLAMFNPDKLIANFRQNLLKELDFTTEAKKHNQMTKSLNELKWIHVPQVHWQYTSQRLLVMEFIHGFKLDQVKQDPDVDLDPRLLALRLSESLFHQIFRMGLMHGDPHPGNLLFLEGNRIGLVDYGIVMTISSTMADKLKDWFCAIVYRDTGLLERTFLEVFTPLAEMDRYVFRNDCQDYIDEHHFQPSHRISAGKIFAVFSNLLYKHKISTPPIFPLVFKVINTMEGVCLRLDPNFDWRQDWKPKFDDLITQHRSPDAVARRSIDLLGDYQRLTRELPDDLREIIKQFKGANLNVVYNLSEDLDTTVRSQVGQLTRALNKLGAALIVSATILGLFHFLKDRDVQFLPWLADSFAPFWPVVLILATLFFYFRRS